MNRVNTISRPIQPSIDPQVGQFYTDENGTYYILTTLCGKYALIDLNDGCPVSNHSVIESAVSNSYGKFTLVPDGTVIQLTIGV